MTKILLINLLLFNIAYAEMSVPTRYKNIIPRINPQSDALINNLIFEGNNIIMRGNLSKEGLFEFDGSQVAKNWINIAKKTKAIFVLRDSLFSQQDHPYRHEPYALILPPNWITAAVISNDLRPVITYKIEDDNSWIDISSPNVLFGSFPISETLFNFASKSLDKNSKSERTKIINARKTISVLSEYSKKLVNTAKDGNKKKIIDMGAELIALSDVRYFTKEVRVKHIIPIFVENPTDKEVEEGKGLYLPGENIDKSLIKSIRDTIYKRRLKDGDIAIERYDLSNENDIKRAIEVLEGIIPKSKHPSGKGNVWLWITGKLDTNKKLSGEDATAYINQFRERIINANIDFSRLKYVCKPSVILPKGEKRKIYFEKTVDRFNALKLPISVTFTSTELLKLIKIRSRSKMVIERTGR